MKLNHRIIWDEAVAVLLPLLVSLYRQSKVLLLNFAANLFPNGHFNR